MNALRFALRLVASAPLAVVSAQWPASQTLDAHRVADEEGDAAQDADADEAPAQDGDSAPEADAPDEAPEPTDEEREAEKARKAKEKRDKELVGKLSKLKITRQPAAVLSTLSRRALPPAPEEEPEEGEEEEEKDEVKELAAAFTDSVVAGDWGGVKAILADLPEEGGVEVYDHLVKQLASDTAILAADDILPLGDACPAELTNAQLASLGGLLGRSGQLTGRPESVLGTLALGTERFGGDDPKKRTAAARLLLGAKMVVEAYPYLAPLSGPESFENYELVNLHALYFETLGRHESDPSAYREAWELTQVVLAAEGVEAKQRSDAVQRVLRLLALLPGEMGDPWLRDVFETREGIALEMLSGLQTKLDGGRKIKTTKSRVETLQVLSRVVTQMLAGQADDTGRWRTAVTFLSTGWLDEAHFTIGAGPVAKGKYEGNSPEWHAGQIYEKRAKERQKVKAVKVAAEELLALAPDAPWLAAVDEDLARQLRHATALVAAKTDNESVAIEIIRAEAAREPELAKKLSDKLITTWASQFKDRSPSRSSSRYVYSSSGSYQPYYSYNQPKGIPLTRSKQVRNVAHLASLKGALEAIDQPELDTKSLVRAFSDCHSKAEIFRVEDVETVFGEAAALSAEVAVGLAQEMRTKLAGQWRNSNVQKAEETKRTDQELVAEVTRGYSLAISMLEPRKGADEDNLLVTLGSLYFDYAEFLYGQKADLETYTVTRDRAFRSYKDGAERYAATVADLRPEEYTAAPFFRWFQSALGASDLAYLTRQDEPDLDQIGGIAAALRGLPADSAGRHLSLFAKSVESSASNVPSQLKPKYFREALGILGEHESGADIRELVLSYDELLAELGIELVIDGSSDVGHGRPFGVHFYLRSTTSLAREAGGLGKYVRNKVYSQATRATVNYKDELEEMLREKLSDGFDIESIVFHEAGAERRGFGKSGWQRTPFAYLVLAARDPAVDRLPPVEVSLDFYDGKGSVLLPVSSPVVLLDARSEDPLPRPAAEVQLAQVLDDRSFEEEGLVRLEIAASAGGLVPELDQLVEVDVPGFTVGEVHDNGLNVNELDTEGDEIVARTDRSWVIELHPVEGETVPSFEFPTALAESAEVTLRHYADEDILEVEGAVTLRGAPSGGLPWWPFALVALAVGAGAVLFVRRRGGSVADEREPRYVTPENATPFTSFALLKRIQSDEEALLSRAQRVELASTLMELEERLFKRAEPASENGVDLDALVRRWVGLAER